MFRHVQLNCISVISAALMSALLVSCDGLDHDHDHDHDHENEIISRVVLTFTPEGGEALSFSFDDPDGDGGASGVAERIELVEGTTYALALTFENALIDPPADITADIEEEAEDHLVLLTGDLSGPASASMMSLLTQAYADLESDYGANAVGDDLPLGLAHTITATSAGTGELRLILRHLPPVNGEAQKSASLPADLAAGRDLPGSVDVDLTFELVVSSP